jgi:hypothetical protein
MSDENYVWRNFEPKRRAAKQHAFYAAGEQAIGATEAPVCDARLTYGNTQDPSVQPFGKCTKCERYIRVQTARRKEAAFIAEREAKRAAMQLPPDAVVPGDGPAQETPEVSS